MAATWPSEGGKEGLFGEALSVRALEPPPPRTPSPLGADAFTVYDPDPDEEVLDVFSRVVDPGDWRQLHDLWLGRVACETGDDHNGAYGMAWRASRRTRSVTAEEMLSSPATAPFIKTLFNTFFRDDLYGRRRALADVILSGGSVDERSFGLSAVLKSSLVYALDQDWYGYSDSRGRVSSRQAIARLENQRLGYEAYDESHVALSLGGTFSVNALADFLLSPSRATQAPALASIPNYPPLVQAIARRVPVSLAPAQCRDGVVSLRGLIQRLTPDTPLVMLQTVNNPTGGLVDEHDLEALIRAASPSTIILLDECHECLGEAPWRSRLRAAPNVVRIASASKSWAAPGLKAGWIIGDPALISDYYEFASTTYGGPPSVLYLFLEVLARMERWMLEGLETLGAAEFREFETHLGLTPASLAAAYDVYRADRRNAEGRLLELRGASIDLMRRNGAEVLVPACSVNATLRFPGWSESYACYRGLLRQTGVSFLPGVLTFCFSGAAMRMTTARPWAELDEVGRRFARHPSVVERV